jgi:hypothetical protein
MGSRGLKAKLDTGLFQQEDKGGRTNLSDLVKSEGKRPPFINLKAYREHLEKCEKFPLL